jgi:hypothetical protein
MTEGWYAPSEEELGKDRDYPVLAEDEYLATVLGVEVKKDVLNRFAKEGEPATHDMLVVKMETTAFANGDDLVDADGEELEQPVRFQAMLDPKKVGMIPQPSKTRKFMAAALGQPVGQQIKVSSWAELIGSKLIVSLRPKDGYNNPFDFRAVRKSRSRGTTPKGPVAGDDLMKKAREIFDEDSPTNTSPNPEASNADDLDF